MDTQRQSLILSVVLLLAGCTTFGEIPQDHKQLNALKAEQEILIVHYPSYPLEMFRMVEGHKSVAWISDGFVPVDDPSSKVESYLITGLMKALDLTNIRSIPKAQSRSAGQVSQREITYRSETVLDLDPHDQFFQLKETFGTGLVLDIDPITWSLYYIAQPQSLSYSAKKMFYELKYFVRARLVRVDDSKVLWKAVCISNLSFSTDSNTGPGRLIDDDGSLLYSKRNEAAERCGNELLTKILQK